MPYRRLAISLPLLHGPRFSPTRSHCIHAPQFDCMEYANQRESLLQYIHAFSCSLERLKVDILFLLPLIRLPWSKSASTKSHKLTTRSIYISRTRMLCNLLLFNAVFGAATNLICYWMCVAGLHSFNRDSNDDAYTRLSYDWIYSLGVLSCTTAHFVPPSPRIVLDPAPIPTFALHPFHSSSSENFRHVHT